MATGKYEPAIEDLNVALNVNANNWEAWVGLGSAKKSSTIARRR